MYESSHRLVDQALRAFFGEPVSKGELAEQNRRLAGGLGLSKIPEAANLATDFAALPAGVAAQLREHYQVIRLEASSDRKEHDAKLDDSKGAMHSLGHDNTVGSRALLDALTRTRGQRR